MWLWDLCSTRERQATQSLSGMQNPDLQRVWIFIPERV